MNKKALVLTTLLLLTTALVSAQGQNCQQTITQETWNDMNLFQRGAFYLNNLFSSNNICIKEEAPYGKKLPSEEELETCTPGEKRPCYEGPEETRNVGACGDGVQTCLEEGVWGGCNAQRLPEFMEICYTIADDNCNGYINEGCEPLPELEQSICGDGVVEGMEECDPPGDHRDCLEAFQCAEGLTEQECLDVQAGTQCLINCQCGFKWSSPPVRKPQDPEPEGGTDCSAFTARYNDGTGIFFDATCCSINDPVPCPNPNEVCVPSTACVGKGENGDVDCSVCLPLTHPDALDYYDLELIEPFQEDRNPERYDELTLREEPNPYPPLVTFFFGG